MPASPGAAMVTPQMPVWAVERIVRFPEGSEHGGGYSHLGFHAPDGTQFVLDHDDHWVGAYDGPDALAWSAGATKPPESRLHVPVELEYPMYVACAPGGGFLVSNFGNARVYRVLPDERRAELVVDGAQLGMNEAGNCVVDADGCIWVNDVTGCRIWRFSASGEPVLTLGTGEPGFDAEPVPLREARFAWVYDIRLGRDGCVYVLDSGNFAVRRIDLGRGLVETIAGTGEPGYTGDGGDARRATFGSDPTERYDGPYSLALDDEGDVFVGDTWNHVLRTVDHRTGVISTIAGDPVVRRGERNDPGERDPHALKLHAICSLDYFDGRLFVPELAGDLVVLARR